MYNTWIVNTPICDFFKFIWKSASQSKHPKNVVTIGSTPDVCSKKLSLAQLQLYPMIIGTPGNTYASFMGVQFFHRIVATQYSPSMLTPRTNGLQVRVDFLNKH